jgi:hypothetical protein
VGHQNGNGGSPRTLLDELGSEDAVVQAFIDAFDPTEISPDDDPGAA